MFYRNKDNTILKKHGFFRPNKKVVEAIEEEAEEIEAQEEAEDISKENNDNDK